MHAFAAILAAALLAAPPTETKPQAAGPHLRVLLVTGVDYPGHLWKETSPAVRKLLEQDPRFEVRIVEDPEFLASPAVFDYDAILLHFKNYQPFHRAGQIRDNLTNFVKQGKGLVLLHFACGAFPDWPEFAQLAGKVWDGVTTHDPRGKFTVRIVDANHPVTRGMKDFEADDELYFCLTGQRKVDTLAVAHSKVKGTDQPMAFAFSYGKGRVFHTPLGHDARAFEMPGVAELIRRGTAWAAGKPQLQPLTAVPFNEVNLRDQFWSARIQTNRRQSLPHDFKWCEQTGRISNFVKAAGHMPGKFEGIYFNDSDVYKVLEGASYCLADQPDAALEKTVDEVIAKIAAAQRPDGYLDTYFILAEPGKRFTDFRSKHELYCAGHFIEAAVAHYRATGKRTLLDVAVKLADCLDHTFGPDKRHEVPGHEEVELALVKLYRVTGEERYLKLANFFIDIRGDKSQRKEIWGPYHQDHLPVREQREIVGHAVRAMYLYCGVADVASCTADQGLLDATQRIWQDVTQRQMYITGGIGARSAGEAFGNAYELPNESAYCETCAAIGLALWAQRLNLLYADGQYADVAERAMLNGVLSGVALDGRQFFYVNPLASKGGHHRQPFFDCACCPTNLVRFIPSVPGCVYATGPDGVYVNLYASNSGKLRLGDSTLTLAQETRYPWDGKVKLSINPLEAPTESKPRLWNGKYKLVLPQPLRFALHLRIPGWCEGAKLTVAGQAVEKLDVEKGYARIERTWKPGDVVELDLPMTIQRIEAHPLVKADQGCVAIERGPIVYCFEAVDNGGKALNIVLPRDPEFAAEYRGDLLGGVTVIHATARDGRKLLAVPYYAWDHRSPGEMTVWVGQEGKSPTPKTDDPTWAGKLYRPWSPAGQ